MDDAFLVGGFEGFGDLFGDLADFVDRLRALAWMAFEQLHDNGVLFEAEDVDMVEGGEGLGFALEAGEVVGIVS